MDSGRSGGAFCTRQKFKISILDSNPVFLCRDQNYHLQSTSTTAITTATTAVVVNIILSDHNENINSPWPFRDRFEIGSAMNFPPFPNHIRIKTVKK